MKARLTITHHCLERLKLRLSLGQCVIIRRHAGLSTGSEVIEFLLPGSALASPSPRRARAALRCFRRAPGCEQARHSYWAVLDEANGGPPHFDLALGIDGSCSAAVVWEGQLIQVSEILVVGPGMERIFPAQPATDFTGLVPMDGPYSRYAGALGGMGRVARLQALRVAVVGCGRLGSAIAASLARAGVRHITLIDPDTLESHSFDSVECFPEGGLGRFKVNAVAEFLRKIAPGIAVNSVPESVATDQGYSACAAADVIVSAPDNDDARLLAGLAAVTHHRVHLDLGTRVFPTTLVATTPGAVRAGADIRLLVPGAACVLCAGLELGRTPAADWRQDRAGSLRSWNLIAAATGMLLLEQLVTEELLTSTSVRIEVFPDGRMESTTFNPRRRRACPLCRPFAGVGDALDPDQVARVAQVAREELRAGEQERGLEDTPF